MRKILVATDFSERSDRAIRRGILLAKSFDASITLVHAINNDQPRRAIRAEQQAANEFLAEQTRSMRELDGLNCESIAVLGNPYEGIVKAAQEEDVDLLLIGPHRQQVLRDVFVGTTAERTIRESDRPVLMANGVPAGPYRHILVAVDLSKCSGDAVRAVQKMGLETKSAVSVVHIFDAPAVGMMVRASSTKGQANDYLAGEEERASGELAAFLKDLNLKPMQQILKHNDSSIAHGICAAAGEASAGLIVVGTQGRTGVAKALIGSVAEEVLRISERDVLVIPPNRAAEFE